VSFDSFAAREPYFSVLTSPKYLRARMDEAARREFLAGGERLVDAMFTTVEQHVAPDFAPTAILEYGCGVGRLVWPLARRAARRGGTVTAVDRSAAMIAAARADPAAAAVSNVEWLDATALAGPDRRFDLVVCYLVLQRMPVQEGLALIRSLAERLVTGGVAVFQFPYFTRASSAQRATRWLRERVPGANAVVNRLRGQPTDLPFIPSHCYSFQDVLATLDRDGLPAAHVVFDDHDDLRSALVVVERPLAREGQVAPGASAAPIEVRDMIAATSVGDLNATAEAYFASLTDWDHHLAKPFATPDEAPWLLANVTEVLHAARLRPGDVVLEFGAGTGWLSRFFTQLGCRAVLLDVSPTALAIARELYARVPVVGSQPPPSFLVFDGERIELPDASVDRVVCFHAFHHAPNPDRVIAEFGRVLKPGGLAVFAEPGPRHSRTPQSQYEMRTYHVVENDVDVHALWRTARASGFRSIELSVFHGKPFRAPLDQYEDLLRGGAMGQVWMDSTREFLRNVRMFTLTKAGQEIEDSRSAAGLACVIVVAGPGPAQAGVPIHLDVTVTNAGSAVWLPAGADPGGVTFGVQVLDESGQLIRTDVLETPLAAMGTGEVLPGQTCRIAVELEPLPVGRYELVVDCVSARVTWFSQRGSVPARVRIDVAL
jgi:ubiquinone/menaquinone biosynthesis C-methylase UbiE